MLERHSSPQEAVVSSSLYSTVQSAPTPLPKRLTKPRRNDEVVPGRVRARTREVFMNVGFVCEIWLDENVMVFSEVNVDGDMTSARQSKKNLGG